MGGSARPLTGQRSNLMELSLRQRLTSHRITQSGFHFAGSAMMPATRVAPRYFLFAVWRLRARSGGVASALPLVLQDITDNYQCRECFATLNEKSPRTDRFRTDRFICPQERQLHKARDLYCAAKRVLLECSSRALLNTVKCSAPLAVIYCSRLSCSEPSTSINSGGSARNPLNTVSRRAVTSRRFPSEPSLSTVSGTRALPFASIVPIFMVYLLLRAESGHQDGGLPGSRHVASRSAPSPRDSAPTDVVWRPVPGSDPRSLRTFRFQCQ